MKKGLSRILSLAALSLLASSVFAAEEMQYHQSKMPDGSTQSEYKSSDGTVMKQIQKPDGTVETTATDSAGNKTVTTQHPNGDVDSKTTTNNQ